MLEMFLLGFSSFLTPQCLLLLLLGVFIGIIFGSIPGLTAAMAVALFLPITFQLEPIQGIVLLIGLYVGGISGGLITAILINIPGTPASIATAFDGFPMAQKGQAYKALGTGILFSCLGGLFSAFALIFISPLLADFAIKFGATEYFAISLFSLTLISSIAKGSVIKGLFAGLLGVLLSCVGVAPVDGSLRFTFGFHSLDAGFNILPLLIGLFAVSEILVLAEEVLTSRQKDFIVREVKREKGFGVSLEEVKSQLGNLFRSSVIGTGIGILPGIGSGTSSMLSYLAAKNSDKRHSERYGTGYIGGIVASETANNATTGGALIPLLTLGIPGDSVTAMILAGFTIHGITPGPLLFTSHTNLVYGIFIAFFLANLIMVVMELFGINLFIKLIKIPRYILMPITMVFCFVGTYGLNNRVFDVWTVLAFGIMGYVLNKLNIPLIPIMLGFILGPLMEKNLRRGLMQAGSFGAFFQSPITTFFLVCTVLSVLWSLYNNIKTFKQKITAQEAKK